MDFHKHGAINPPKSPFGKGGLLRPFHIKREISMTTYAGVLEVNT